MAMIKCPECGKEISDRAVACPNCAFPIAEAKTDGIIRIKLGTIKSGLGSKQSVTISSNDKVLWEGKVGTIAEIKIDEPMNIDIKYHLNAVHYGGSCSGEIDPSKGKKYFVQARQGFMKTILNFQRVDIFDSE